MKLKQPKVASLKLSKKLEKLGVKQKSVFYWWGNRDGKKMIIAFNEDIMTGIIPVGIKEKGYCSAFTVAELMKIDYHWDCSRITSGQYSVIIPMPRPFNKASMAFLSKNPANAFAKMRIYLIENKLIKE